MKRDSKEQVKNCTECEYHEKISWADGFCGCNYPGVNLSLLGAAKVSKPMNEANKKVARELAIRAEERAVLRGWFNWPYFFNPKWLNQCMGYTQKRKVDQHADS